MPTEILFGPGALDKLSVATLPGRKAMIVTGGTSVRKLGYLDRVVALLKQRQVESVVYDKVKPNPIVESVMEAASIARSEGCDFIIGLGGGSSMDSAKSIALMANNPGDYWDYMFGSTGGKKTAPNRALPIVCITTTAGTGTEADPWTVISKESTKEKLGFGSRDLFPTLSIVDPELMTSVPPHLTAYQGFDALFHSIEGYVANISSPVSDMFALKAIEFVVTYLPRAVRDGADIEARHYVAIANTLSGFVESLSSCTSEHAIEHAMSAFHPELPHGAGLIMISLAYHRAFASSCPERYAALGRVFGEEASVEGFLSGLKKLQEACGVDRLKMSDYGMEEERFGDYADTAIKTGKEMFGMDRCSLDQEAVVSILQQSWK